LVKFSGERPIKRITVRWDGKFVRLGDQEDYARKRHRQLCIESGALKNPNVADLVEIYLSHCVNKPLRPIKPRTLAKKRGILATFVAMFGGKSPRVITDKHEYDWLKNVYPKANPTTRKDRIVEVKAVWGHALKRGIISRNPMALIETDTPSKRVHHVPYDRWPELLAACPNDSLRSVVEFMLFTGARPQEVVILQPGDWYGTYFMLPVERSKGEREERYIYVPEFLLAMVNRLVTEGREFVFTNTKGGQWNKDSLNTAFRELKVSMGDKKLCPTSCRHSFATWKLVAGVPIETVAKLMGHTSTRMVYSRYGHWHGTNILANGTNAGT
jgi:integrase/recombinase XerD